MDFSSRHHFQSLSGAQLDFFPFSPAGSLLGREASHQRLLAPTLRNAWDCISALSYYFVAGWLIVHNDNFNVTFYEVSEGCLHLEATNSHPTNKDQRQHNFTEMHIWRGALLTQPPKGTSYVITEHCNRETWAPTAEPTWHSHKASFSYNLLLINFERSAFI
jgi:hypothetical protein